MIKKRLEPLGVGTYSVPEAARLSGVSSGSIRRWLRGYTFESERGRRSSAPIWRSELGAERGELELGFRDLVELRAIRAFLNDGVTWPVLRRAHERAVQMVGHPHPFSSRTFSTDGRRIFAELVTEKSEPLPTDVITGQAYFEKILRPLLRQIEFDEHALPERWWPMGSSRRVVIDPRRSFGQPIVAREGVPTRALAAAIEAGDSRATVARWFEVSLRSLTDAVAFEQQLAA